MPDVRSERAEPTVFGAADRQLLGLYHAPAPGAAGPLGVVLCSPLGYEAMSAHATYRHLATRLADAGLPALRFDYRATGDSSGDAHDTDRLRAWVEDIRTAMHELRARSGVSRVALLGMRFGASLATLAAAEVQDVEAFVAWAPVVSGRTLVRELRAFRMLKEPKAKRPDGSEEIGGYFFAGDTLSEMSGVDLLALPVGGIARALVVPRAAQPATDEVALVDHWKAAGVEASVCAEPGYAQLMRDDPYESVVPFPALDAIVAWLRETKVETPRATPTARPASTVLTLTTGPDRPRLRETSVVFGDRRRLFGVLGEPSGAARRDRPAAIFLNVGANPHVGPHRMNVEHARELAALGYTTFRFDAAGLGESLVAGGQQENRLYTMDAVDDVQSAMTWLEREGKATRFVLIGLCSGTYVAFHTATRDHRVVGQVLLSPFAFEYRAGDQTQRKFNSTNSYGRALTDPRFWRRAVRGEVNFRGVAETLHERLRARAKARLRSARARLRGERGPDNDVERAFVEMCERGVETLIVLSFYEGGRDLVARYLGTDASKMRRYATFKLDVVDGPDRTYTLASAPMLGDILTRYMTSRFR